MNTYFVFVRADKENRPDVRDEPYYGGLEPSEPVWCADIVEAETRAQAKALFIAKWAGGGVRRSPVYHDDWVLLRVRLLGEGVLSERAAWERIHEVLDHGGAACDCPIEEDLPDAA